jgi:hypothetical protein
MSRDASSQTYFLDLPTLFSILSRQKRSGHLWTKPTRIPPLKDLVSASIQIDSGILRNCQLMQKNAVLLEGEQAYQMVIKMPAQEWYWRIDLVSQQPIAIPAPALPSGKLPSSEVIFYPTRTPKAQERQFIQYLTRPYFHILSLCDGTQSSQRIAAMLNISTLDLYHALRDLEAWGFIVLQYS